MKEKISNIIILLFMGLFLIQNVSADSQEVIKIGAPNPFTGPYAADGIVYLRGLKMAVEEINDAGGLLGLPLEVVTFDTKDFSPETLIRASHQLVEIDKVDTIHAGWAGNGPDYRAFGRYEIPTFVWDASEDSINVYRENPNKYSNMFMVAPPEYDHAYETIQALEQLDFNFSNNNIVIINADDTWCRKMGEAIEEITKDKRWEITYHEVVPYGNRNWLPILKLIRDANPAYIHFEMLSLPDMISFYNQFMKSPTNSLLNFSYGTTFVDFREIMSNKIDGLLGMSAGIEIHDDTSTEIGIWFNEYNEKYGAVATPGSWMGYNCIKVWAKAVEKTGSYKNYSKINAYIASHSFKNIAGGEWRFNEDQFIPFSNNAPCVLYQIQNDRPVSIYSTNSKINEKKLFIKPSWIRR
ncbi:MAG: ABC transporter substrate-binding protein [Desulfobacterales bacterium]|nr:ABC transporter substrate-binding protein [Desulfobacterales bacterium]